MNIGEAAKSSGVSAKTIRHYEQAGLIRPATRTESNYRLYTQTDIEVLRFIKQARRLGFSMKQVAALLGLWQDRSRPSREVKRLAQEHIDDLESRIRELMAMKETLADLVRHCKGNARPDCPILDELSGQHRDATVAISQERH